MTDNFKPAQGHTQLNDGQLEFIKKIRAQGELIESLITELETSNADLRWVSIAKTDLQKGLMSLVRSVAKPEFF